MGENFNLNWLSFAYERNFHPNRSAQFLTEWE
jgi:hypothetical protein